MSSRPAGTVEMAIIEAKCSVCGAAVSVPAPEGPQSIDRVMRALEDALVPHRAVCAMPAEVRAA
jgi:hypothetical protein